MTISLDAYAQHLKSQLGGKKPSWFVVSVGGGGLLCGVLRGLDIVGKSAAYGCNDGNRRSKLLPFVSCQAGKLVTKPQVTVAKTLGGSSVNLILMDWLHEYNIISHFLSDKEAVRGCVRFAGIRRSWNIGRALLWYFSSSHIFWITPPRILDKNGYDSEAGPIVIIVCGGSDVTPQILLDFTKEYNL